MTKSLFSVCAWLLFVVEASADAGWYERYVALAKGENTDSLCSFIEEWEKAEGDTPDVYAAWFNYYIRLAKHEVVTLNTAPPEDGEALQLLNDSTGEAAGYLYSDVSYNDSLLQLGYDKIDQAIAKYPSRLDLPFGMISLLLLQGKYDQALAEMGRVITRSGQNDNHWLWTLNEPVEDGESVFKGSMQDYFGQLYDAEQDSLASCLTDWMIDRYPHDVVFRSNKASLLAVKGDLATALSLYLAILEDAPEDAIVISNIAYIYKKQGDKENARKYYRRLMDIGDEEMKAFAEEELKKL